MEFVYWYWWVLAFGCLILEMLTPGFFFMWLAMAGALTGLIAFVLSELSVNIQVVLFSVFAILAVAGWRKFGQLWRAESDQPLLNKRGAQYIGRKFLVHEAIVNGEGKIKIGDTLWKVTGEDCPANTSVVVKGINGTTLEVGPG